MRICASCAFSMKDGRTGSSMHLCIRPRRTAMLLIGGDKTGNNRWYDEYVPLADTIYDRLLRELENE
jgi:hypothetical protein